jgi:hypothetical protein
VDVLALVLGRTDTPSLRRVMDAKGEPYGAQLPVGEWRLPTAGAHGAITRRCAACSKWWFDTIN